MVKNIDKLPSDLFKQVNTTFLWRVVQAIGQFRNGRTPLRLLNMAAAITSQKPYFVSATNRGIVFLGDMRDNYAMHCAANTGFDEHIVGLIENQISGKNGIYLDIGTNLGVVAASIAKLHSGTVYAFEPVPETYQRAQGTALLNDLSNIVIYNKAVGEQNGQITFYKPINHSEGASAVRNEYVQECGSEEIIVEVITVDSLVGDFKDQKVIFMKIDVEGFEPQVIKGARKVISEHAPQILFEYHPKVAPSSGWRAEDVVELIIQDRPYNFSVLYETGEIGTFPPRPGMIANILATPA